MFYARQVPADRDCDIIRFAPRQAQATSKEMGQICLLKLMDIYVVLHAFHAQSWCITVTGSRGHQRHPPLCLDFARLCLHACLHCPRCRCSACLHEASLTLIAGIGCLACMANRFALRLPACLLLSAPVTAASSADGWHVARSL